jgi:hypothetical protein
MKIPPRVGESRLVPFRSQSFFFWYKIELYLTLYNLLYPAGSPPGLVSREVAEDLGRFLFPQGLLHSENGFSHHQGAVGLGVAGHLQGAGDLVNPVGLRGVEM